MSNIKRENILEEYYLEMDYKKDKRRIRVILPYSYNQNKSRKYPVVYFHDGQNIFFDNESYSGRSWGLIETIMENKNLKEFIGVAIDNSPARMAEYSPWPLDQSLADLKIERPEGDAYADFILNTLKPFIDQKYRTKKSKKFTSMIGSSAGANISAFIGKKYQGKIGSLGIFSLASFAFKEKFENYFKDVRLKDNQKIYIKVGTEESEERNISQAYIDSSVNYYDLLIKAGIPIENIKLKIISGDTHSERDWAKYLLECLEFVLQ